MGGRRTARGGARRVVLVAVAVVVAAFIVGRATAGEDDDHTAAALVGAVTSVTDGDTIRLDDERVRLLGIDTPERGECGFDESGDRLRDLVDRRTVSIVAAPGQTRDRYGRLLGYVEVGDVDAGRVLIAEGLAVARYDSRDGYPAHPREADYRRLDATTPNICG